MARFKLNQLVEIMYGSIGFVGISDEMWDLKGKLARISKIVVSERGTYYELDGCRSERGIPFSFTGDWLRPAKERTDD